MTTKGNETVKFYKNVTVVELVRYSRSYGTRTIEVKYSAAMVDGDWLFPIDNNSGKNYSKQNLKAKYVVSFSGTEVKEPTFNKIVKQLQKDFEDRKLARELKEANEKIQKEQMLTNLTNQLPLAVLEVMPKLQSMDLAVCFADRKSHNEKLNKAVGLVGYHFAKWLGWNNVVNEIEKQYYNK